MPKGTKVGDHSAKNGMHSGTQTKTKSAGSDPYNKAGKAAGRDATSWSKGGTVKSGPGAYK